MAATTNLPSSTGSGDLDNIAVTRAEFRNEIGILLEYLAQALGNVDGDYTNEAVKPTEVKLQGTPIIDDGANPVTESADQRIPSTKWVKESGTYVSDDPYGKDISGLDPVDGQLWVDTSTDANYVLKAYNSSVSPAAWQLVGGFPTGTTMLFQNAAAPTGWTKESDDKFNNTALRLTTGSPVITTGNQNFTTVFTTQTIDGDVGDTTLTKDQMPKHKHGITDLEHDHGGSATVTDDHTHAIGPLEQFYGADPRGSRPAGWCSGDRSTGFTSSVTNAASTGDIDVDIPAGKSNITVQETGADEAHTHGFDGTNLNLAINYVDVIVATKD